MAGSCCEASVCMTVFEFEQDGHALKMRNCFPDVSESVLNSLCLSEHSPNLFLEQTKLRIYDFDVDYFVILSIACVCVYFVFVCVHCMCVCVCVCVCVTGTETADPEIHLVTPRTCSCPHSVAFSSPHYIFGSNVNIFVDRNNRKRSQPFLSWFLCVCAWVWMCLCGCGCACV